MMMWVQIMGGYAIVCIPGYTIVLKRYTPGESG